MRISVDLPRRWAEQAEHPLLDDQIHVLEGAHAILVDMGQVLDGSSIERRVSARSLAHPTARLA